MKSLKDKLKKIEWSNLIFHNRHCLAFITILVFLMLYGGVAHAEEADVGNDASYTSEDLRTSLGIEGSSKPVISANSMNTDYVLTTGGNASNLSYGAYYGLGSYLTDGIFDRTCFPTSITVNQTTVSFSSTAYFANCWYSSQGWVQSMRISGEGRFFLSNNGSYTEAVVCSDAPFTVGWVRNYSNSGFARVGIEIINNQDANSGLYKYTPFAHDSYVTLTNMPIYLASSDGYSGFTSGSQSDFNFTAENYDFNNLVYQGTVVVPESPVDPNAPIVGQEGQYYTYAGVDVDFVGLSNSAGFTANYTFSLNSYMQNHPEDYTVITDYQITATYDGNTEVFGYEDYIDGEALVYNGGKYSQVMGFNMFFNNTETFTDFLKRIWRVTVGASDSSGYVDGSVISYGVGSSGGSRAFGRFNYGINQPFQAVIPHLRIDTITKIRFNGEPMQESGNLRAYYDFVSKQSKILENGISTNNNPAPSGTLTNYNPYISPNSSGSGTDALYSASAVIQSGAIQITNGGGAGFQMPQESWNNFGDLLLEMRNDLTTLTDDNGVASAMQCVQTVTSGILPEGQGGTPNKLWFLIYGGVAGSIAIALWNKAAHNH